MAKIDKVHGDTILLLFKECLQDGLPLKFSLKNGNYQRLTYIADILKQKRIYYFQIECHRSFQIATADLEIISLDFEFVGRDGIKYTFETIVGDISPDVVRIRFPEVAYRYQRRRLFRLEAPHGTRLYFNVKEARYKLLIINVSLGGTLGVFKGLTKKMEQELKLFSPQVIENAELIFPSQSEARGSKVNIKKCRIVRQERNLLTQKYECALEFKEISEDQQDKLTELFYQWQREYLRKRKQLRV
jgi:c-di-GMP-binding flagellar brake protein YcgR